MRERRRKFTPEFKDEAVKLVIETSRPIAEVAREIRVNEGTLGNWVNKYRVDHADEEPPLTVSGRARLRTAARHERDHFVRGARGLDRDLATGLSFELRDPVVCFVRLAVFDVARPRDDVEGSF